MDAEASGIWRSLPAGGGQKPLLVWLSDKQASSKTAISAAGRISQRSRDSVSFSQGQGAWFPASQTGSYSPVCTTRTAGSRHSSATVCHSAPCQANGTHPVPAHGHQSRAAGHAAASNGLAVSGRKLKVKIS